MTFVPDTLIAIAFIAPVACFAALDIVTFRMHLYTAAVKLAAQESPFDADCVAPDAVAANDADIRVAA